MNGKTYPPSWGTSMGGHSVHSYAQCLQFSLLRIQKEAKLSKVLFQKWPLVPISYSRQSGRLSTSASYFATNPRTSTYSPSADTSRTTDSHPPLARSRASAKRAKGTKRAKRVQERYPSLSPESAAPELSPYIVRMRRLVA